MVLFSEMLPVPHTRPEKETETGSQWYRGKGFGHDGSRKNLLGMHISHAKVSETGMLMSFGTYKHFYTTARNFRINTWEAQMLGFTWHPQSKKHLQDLVEGGQVNTV